MRRAASWQFRADFRTARPAYPLLPGSTGGTVVKVAAAVAALLVFAAAPARAQVAVAAADRQAPIFKSGAALVALNVTVQDPRARYISGLRPEDFAVYEDGVKQDVRFFESSAVPVDLIVLIDASSSMGDKLDVVHQAATGFLRTLRPGDRGAVVTFADSVTVVQPLTSDRALLEKAVRGTVAFGSTSLNNAIYISLKQFGQSARQDGDVRRQAIVVLSDGEDTSSLVSFDDVLALARKTGVNIYTVGLQSKYAAMRESEQGAHRYFSEADYSMKTLARETGAQAFFPDSTQLKGVYDAIALELANQYSIGYLPANARPDGRFRRVVVQVVSKPELRPRTRLGYVADGAVVSAVPGAGGLELQPR
jgi:Ca-activated chloride channel homolog